MHPNEWQFIKENVNESCNSQGKPEIRIFWYMIIYNKTQSFRLWLIYGGTVETQYYAECLS